MVISTILSMWYGCLLGMLIKFSFFAIIRGKLLDPHTEMDNTAIAMAAVTPFGAIIGLIL